MWRRASRFIALRVFSPLPAGISRKAPLLFGLRRRLAALEARIAAVEAAERPLAAPRKATESGQAAARTEEADDAEAALLALPNRDDMYDHAAWVRLGLSLYAAGGSFQVFSAWSARHLSYDPKQTAATWASFEKTSAREIGPGTLFGEVRARVPGWQKPSALRRRAEAPGDAATDRRRGALRHCPAAQRSEAAGRSASSPAPRLQGRAAAAGARAGSTAPRRQGPARRTMGSVQVDSAARSLRVPHDGYTLRRPPRAPTGRRAPVCGGGARRRAVPAKRARAGQAGERGD